MAKNGEKKSSGGKLLLFVLLLAAGGAVAGYLKPDLPVVGPAVGWVVGQASSGLDKTGEYEVSIENLTINHEEFTKGSNVELRVIITQYNADGREVMEWDSDEFGEVEREAGKDKMSADWKHTPIKKIIWRHGDKFEIKVLDGREQLCIWTTNPQAKEFELNGTHSFDRIRDQRERKGDKNEITFSAKRVGDLPPAKP